MSNSTRSGRTSTTSSNLVAVGNPNPNPTENPNPIENLNPTENTIPPTPTSGETRVATNLIVGEHSLPPKLGSKRKSM